MLTAGEARKIANATAQMLLSVIIQEIRENAERGVCAITLDDEPFATWAYLSEWTGLSGEVVGELSKLGYRVVVVSAPGTYTDRKIKVSW